MQKNTGSKGQLERHRPTSIELTKLILGGYIDRKNGYVYQIQRPGADHHARWMSKAIYMATRLNSNITRNEESYQELVHVVEGHRKKYELKTKEYLRKFN